MTHVSKQPLAPKQQVELQRQLAELLASCTTRTAGSLVGELFTASEQMMLMKRVAIIAMVAKGYSKYRVAKTLHVSESTVLRISEQVQAGHYKKMLKTIRSKQFDSEAFWHTLEVILQAGMPPMGRGRWKFLDS